MSNYPITFKGYEKMVAELDDLQSNQRPAVIKAIAAAREHGDLKENAEYHSAREKQSFIEGRIRELADKISRASVVDPKMVKEKDITFSATIKLLDYDTDKEVEYQIVSEYEADINNNLISNTSPIARGLIGKSEGDDVEIVTPKGKKEFEILKVEYK